MPPKSKKRVTNANDYDSDGGFVEDAPKSKRAKTTNPISKDKQLDDDETPYWELSGKRRVNLSEYRGVHLVNIREFYEKDGKMLPGKKGISLSLEQFSALVEILPDIEETLKARGQELPRPNYGSESHAPQVSVSANDGEDAEDEGPGEQSSASHPSSHKLDRFKYEKKNHEATSDEDD